MNSSSPGVGSRSRLAESEREAGVAAERQRLAHEIHDTVAQGLSSIQMLLYAAERDISDDSPALDRLQVARKVAAENLRDTRAIIPALQPRALQDGTLTDAPCRLATTTEENFPGLTVDSPWATARIPAPSPRGLSRCPRR